MACARHHEASPALSTRAPKSWRSVLGGKRGHESHQERRRKRRAREGMRCTCGRLLIGRVWPASTPRAENHAVS
eukprot:scaffold22520_cov66-Phaeocystis_antarctica.AAC.2